jgi:hypothetical protein
MPIAERIGHRGAELIRQARDDIADLRKEVPSAQAQDQRPSDCPQDARASDEAERKPRRRELMLTMKVEYALRAENSPDGDRDRAASGLNGTRKHGLGPAEQVL